MNNLGYIAGFLTLIGYLPQTIKVVRTRKTKDLSFASFGLIGTAAIFWLIYGISLEAPAIWVTNSVVAACSVTILWIKVREG